MSKQREKNNIQPVTFPSIYRQRFAVLIFHEVPINIHKYTMITILREVRFSIYILLK
jgi:hypothetical protein